MRDMRACVCVLVQVAGYFIHGNFDVQRFITLNIYMNEEAPIEYYIIWRHRRICTAILNTAER